MEKVDNRRLGTHLKRLREERKLTLGAVERLSADHGERINKTYLFRVERGKTVPTIPRLRALGKVYHVKLGHLLEVLDGAFEETERESTLDVDPEGGTFEELRKSGIEAVREGDFAKAILLFRAACEKAAMEEQSPERALRLATAGHDLSIALKNAGRLELARDQEETAIEQPGLPLELLDRIRLNLAAIYRKLGRIMMAREILDGLLSRQEGVSEQVRSGAHSLMGSTILADDPREATRHYRSALSIVRRLHNPLEECKLRFNVGLGETKAGNFQRALRTLLAARDLARRQDYHYWAAKIQTCISQTLYLKGDRAGARAAIRMASEFARHRDYFDLLFANRYYQWKLAIEENNATEVRASEASLRFFATRIEESFEELEAFRKELAGRKEATL